MPKFERPPWEQEGALGEAWEEKDEAKTEAMKEEIKKDIKAAQKSAEEPEKMFTPAQTKAMENIRMIKSKLETFSENRAEKLRSILSESEWNNLVFDAEELEQMENEKGREIVSADSRTIYREILAADKAAEAAKEEQAA